MGDDRNKRANPVQAGQLLVDAQKIANDPRIANFWNTPKGQLASLRNSNDVFREAGGRICEIPGMWTLSRGICALTAEDRLAIVKLVADYGQFDEDNDPWMEHDFGDLKYKDHDILWKIDYYNTTLDAASPDKYNDDVTLRVLTVMRSSEY